MEILFGEDESVVVKEMGTFGSFTVFFPTLKITQIIKTS
ncbi:hypothetical protein FM121_03410 [Vagococcus fluvialis bH819]|uniref:Uncharacterized protein n=1 Tax=Vagococcus fluvialis bH819 TaxID=1255619 RepID=A0A1X6WLI3_9ENTE|nr:hypothetical protein FM121_03410 [Vagococcus fluvialis bH819]